MTNGRNVTAAAIVLTAALLTPGVASAQEELARPYELGLRDAMLMALENNLDLVSARFTPQLREQDVLAQDTAFDVGLEGSLNHQEREQATTQQSAVTGSESNSMSLGVRQTTPWGASWTAGFGVSESNITGPDVIAPTSYFSGLSFTFDMPLLKGFGTETNTEALVLAENALETSRIDLEGRAESILETAESAYWNVLASRESLRIARLSLQRAQDTLERNRKKVEVGTLAPIEITQAEAQVASQDQIVIAAEADLEDAEDELLRLLGLPEADPRWERPIVPTERPSFEIKEVDLDAAISTALENRSEMYRSRQAVRDSELSERVARRQVRHQLDFNAQYDPSGSSLDSPGGVILTPDLREIVVFPEDADLGPSIARIFTGEEYSWSTGLTYRIPIGNRQAKASYARARLARAQSEVDLQNQEQSIRVEVRKAVRAVESGIKQVDAARANVLLQQKKLEAEEKKFENGMTTSFEVLTFQRDLADAELSEIQARLAYIRALVSLERAKGTLLESKNLSLSM